MAFIKKTLDILNVPGVTEGVNTITVKAVNNSGLPESDASVALAYELNGFTFEWDEANGYYICTGFGDTTVTDITIPSVHPVDSLKVGAIGDSAFSYSNITSVTIPNTIQRIGKAAFQGAKLTTVVIPQSVNYIGIRAFDRCSNLTTVTFAANSSLTEIDELAFYYCTALATINLPASLKIIGNSAFAYCTNLYATGSNTGENTLVLPSGLTTIEGYAFSGIGAYAVDLDNTQIETIGGSAFANCPNLMHVFAKTPTLKKIEASAFKGCSNLEGIEIPDTLEWIGRKAFEGCENLGTLGLAWYSNSTGAYVNCPMGWFYLNPVTGTNGVVRAPNIPSQIYTGHNAEHMGIVNVAILTDTLVNKYFFRINKMQKPYVKLDGDVLTIADTTLLANSFNIYITDASGNTTKTNVPVYEEEIDYTGVNEEYLTT